MKHFFVEFYNLIKTRRSEGLQTARPSLFSLLFYFLITWASPLQAEVRGLYISANTILSKKKLGYIIEKSVETGVTTFIVDIDLSDEDLEEKTMVWKRYKQNINLILEKNIEYIARVAVFPDGATPEQVIHKPFWQKKLKSIKKAISLGAKAVQLDYIRYSTKQERSPENEKNIHEVIRWFKEHLKKESVPLQIDVFGESAYHPMEEIGQNIVTFADTVDAVCPMVYPSHFRPYETSHKTPFETISTALIKLKEQFEDAGKPIPFKIIPYIEVVNFRHHQSKEKKIEYLRKEIEAVRSSSAAGWYTWSAGNFYDPLFQVLREEIAQTGAKTIPQETTPKETTP